MNNAGEIESCSFRQQLLQNRALQAKQFLLIPVAELPAATLIAGQKPAEMPLAGFIGQALCARIIRAGQGFPAWMLLQGRATSVDDKQQEQMFFQRHPQTAPSLLTTLHRARRHTQELRQFSLAESHLLPDRSDVGKFNLHVYATRLFLTITL